MEVKWVAVWIYGSGVVFFNSHCYSNANVSNKDYFRDMGGAKTKICDKIIYMYPELWFIRKNGSNLNPALIVAL